jgi:hypothetical protein
MTIRFKWRGRIFNVTIGRTLPWSRSLYWISIIEEFYGPMCQVEHATWIKGFFEKGVNKYGR